MARLNATHDPALRSWVESANAPGADFPIQNLPLGVFRRRGESAARARGGVAIGDRILDLAAAVRAGLFAGGAAEEAARAAAGPALNPLMAMGNAAASALRARVSALLAAGAPERARVEPLLVPMAEAEMLPPAAIGAFTDFLTSTYHTERGGRRTRPDSPLPPNFKHLPVAYNSRASSVRVSGEAVRRPNGQRQRPDGTVHFGPCEALDFELELGLFVGPGNPLGEPVHMDFAPDHMFGYCLLNDWSARDIQRWESHPLGPFLSKSFATSISPWVVTAEALEPFRAPAFPRAAGDPEPLPYLRSEADRREGLMDIRMEAFLLTPRMCERGEAPARVTATRFTNMYWTFAQMLTHHMSNGCNLRPGDLLGSGTASGPTDESRACMAELTEAGTQPLALPNGETRRWLEDGDEVIFRARAERDGFVPIGFGECRGRIAPAPAWPRGRDDA
jgi:fumarylacetoacetase